MGIHPYVENNEHRNMKPGGPIGLQDIPFDPVGAQQMGPPYLPQSTSMGLEVNPGSQIGRRDVSFGTTRCPNGSGKLTPNAPPQPWRRPGGPIGRRDVLMYLYIYIYIYDIYIYIYIYIHIHI